MEQWLTEMFKAIDARDADGFLSFLDDDATFVLANAEPVHGRDAIREMFSEFNAVIGGMSHTLHESWRDGDVVIVRGEVTYTRIDGSALAVPFCNVFKMSGDRVREYLIYVDASQLHG